MANHHMTLHQIYEILCSQGGENIGCGTETVFLQNTANHILDILKSTCK